VDALSNILADWPGVLARGSDDDGYFKLIGLAIVVVIWIVGAIASAIQKASKKREQDMAAARLSNAANPPPTIRPVVPPVGYLAPASVRSAPPPNPTPKKKKGSRQRQPAAPPPLEAVAPRAEPAAVPPAIPKIAARPGLNASAIRRWLTPEVMRRQYVLTELFDSPPSAKKPGR
jgi:hypothetical protein